MKLDKSFLAHIRVRIKICTKYIRITKKSGHAESRKAFLRM